MQNVIRWMLGGLVVFSLAACSPANEGEGEEGSGAAVEQQEGENGSEEGEEEDN